MKNKLIVLSGLFLGLPLIASVAVAQSGVAATCQEFRSEGTIETFVCRIGGILNTIIPFLIVLGVLYFVWGVVTYVIAGDEEAKKKGRDKIIYGIIGLAVIIGVWGLVGILNRTLNPDASGGPIGIPCVVGTPGC